MPDTKPLNLDEIEARVAAASEGPWFCRSSYVYRKPNTTITDYRPDVPGYCVFREKTDGPFIAHSRTDIPALIAEVRALRAALQVFADCPPGADVIGGRQLAREALKGAG